jgi:hypothetical protein
MFSRLSAGHKQLKLVSSIKTQRLKFFQHTLAVEEKKASKSKIKLAIYIKRLKLTGVNLGDSVSRSFT